MADGFWISVSQLETISVGSSRQTYPTSGKELPLSIRIYDRATGEYGSGGKLSFIVGQGTGGVASAFHCAVVR
jgi:hypothetical protein